MNTTSTTRRVQITCILLFAAFAANAQTTLPQTEQLHKIKLSVTGLTYQWEKPISRKSVFTAEAGAAGGWALHGSSWTGTDFEYYISPYVSAGVRNYYNLDKRFNKGKNVSSNAANFFTGELFGTGPAIIHSDWGNHNVDKNPLNDYQMGINAAWGIQRNLSKKVNFELQLGVTAATNFKQVAFGPKIGLGFGLLAGKARK